MPPAAAWGLLLALVVVGCGKSGSSTLAARGRTLPTLTERCGQGAGKAARVTTGWFRAPDGVLLDGASLGSGSTGIALAHESPGDLCGWVTYAGVLSSAGFRVLLFDLREFGLSQSPTADAKSGRFSRDFEGAVAELRREGSSRVFIGGASFGGAASMVAGSRLGSRIAGVVSFSGEPNLGNKYGPNTELDAQAAVPSLRAPLLSSARARTATSRSTRPGRWSAAPARRTSASRCSPAAITAGISSASLPTTSARAGC